VCVTCIKRYLEGVVRRDVQRATGDRHLGVVGTRRDGRTGFYYGECVCVCIAQASGDASTKHLPDIIRLNSAMGLNNLQSIDQHAQLLIQLRAPLDCTAACVRV
jgi:hypothetical protein